MYSYFNTGHIFSSSQQPCQEGSGSSPQRIKKGPLPGRLYVSFKGMTHNRFLQLTSQLTLNLIVLPPGKPNRSVPIKLVSGRGNCINVCFPKCIIVWKSQIRKAGYKGSFSHSKICLVLLTVRPDRLLVSFRVKTSLASLPQHHTSENQVKKKRLSILSTFEAAYNCSFGSEQLLCFKHLWLS